MTGFQKVVIGVAAALIIFQVFNPVIRYGLDIPQTLLRLVGLLISAAAVIYLFPSPNRPTKVILYVLMIFGAIYFITSNAPVLRRFAP